MAKNKLITTEITCMHTRHTTHTQERASGVPIYMYTHTHVHMRAYTHTYICTCMRLATLFCDHTHIRTHCNISGTLMNTHVHPQCETAWKTCDRQSIISFYISLSLQCLKNSIMEVHLWPKETKRIFFSPVIDQNLIHKQDSCGWFFLCNNIITWINKRLSIISPFCICHCSFAKDILNKKNQITYPYGLHILVWYPGWYAHPALRTCNCLFLNNMLHTCTCIFCKKIILF